MGTDYISPEFSIPGKATSYWIDSTPDTKIPKVKKDLEFDTIIIGAGITGITAGYLLKEAGQKVAILEMREIIKDVTGHTTAKITSQHGLIYKYLIDNFGKSKAKEYADAQQEAIEIIRNLVEELDIDCDFVENKAYVFARTKEGLKEIEEEVGAAQDLGLLASFQKEIELPLDQYGAICFENQAQFHPRKYLLTLAQKIFDGSYIFEKSKVVDIKEGEICEVITEDGQTLKAKNVIVATHFPFYDKGSFFAKMDPRRSYVYGVKIRGEVPEGMYYTIDKGMNSFRYQESENGKILLVSGESHKAGQGDNEIDCYKGLEKFARENFDVISFFYHWSTQDNFTTDRIPYIGLSPKSKNIYIATGYGGWGMTNGTIAAKIISDLIIKGESPYQSLFDPSREKPFKAAKKFFSHNANVAKEFMKGKVPHKFGLPIDIPYGEGGVIEYGGEKIAVYKDDDGNVLRYSAKCTHLGCIVNWNEAEKTWDCPCHGSRFTASGDNIHGPAIKPLQKIDETIIDFKNK